MRGGVGHRVSRLLREGAGPMMLPNWHRALQVESQFHRCSVGRLAGQSPCTGLCGPPPALLQAAWPAAACRSALPSAKLPGALRGSLHRHSASVLILSEQRERLREHGERASEGYRGGPVASRDAPSARAEVRRQLETLLVRIIDHQRRNVIARKTHSQTRWERLEEAGVDRLGAARRCPSVL